jgi:transposase-like protein
MNTLGHLLTKWWGQVKPSRWGQVGLTHASSATQRELAETYGVDRTTIRSICATAKQGAIEALAAAVPGRRGKSAEQVELEQAYAEIERLKATICEQAVSLHLEKGKDGWD